MIKDLDQKYEAALHGDETAQGIMISPSFFIYLFHIFEFNIVRD